MLTINKNAERLSKKAAYELIVKMKKGETLELWQIDSLMLYFAPPIPKTAKTAEQWVAKAVNKNDGTRPYLMYLHVSNGWLCGTDGHRLHRCHTELPDGYYDPKTLAKCEVSHNYPQVDRLFYQHKVESFDVEYMTRTVVKGVNCLSIEDLHWNEQYIRDATNNATSCNVTYDTDKRCKQMYGKSEFGEFIVMGIN